MTDQYKDRYTKPTKDLSEKSAFVCKSCNKQYNKEEAKQKEMSCCGRSLTELMQESFGP